MIDAELDAHLAAAFGIFSGQPTEQVVLWFSAHRARRVADEIWHPDQTTRWLPDGRYELTLAYSEAPELLMDILKHGKDLEVRAPEKLRALVVHTPQETLRLYEQVAQERRLYHRILECRPEVNSRWRIPEIPL